MMFIESNKIILKIFTSSKNKMSLRKGITKEPQSIIWKQYKDAIFYQCNEAEKKATPVLYQYPNY